MFLLFIDFKETAMDELAKMDAFLDAADRAYDNGVEDGVSDEFYDEYLANRNRLADMLGKPHRSLRVTVDPDSEKLYPHKHFMGSLTNFIDSGEPDFMRHQVSSWIYRTVIRHFSKLDKEIVPIPFCWSPKYDGLALSIEQDKQTLQIARAMTRGTGTHGEDVTDVVKRIPGLTDNPLFQRREVIRGELVLTHADMTLLNEERVAAGKPTLVKPRNAAVGILKEGGAAVRYLKFMPYASFDFDGVFSLEGAQTPIEPVLNLSVELIQGPTENLMAAIHEVTDSILRAFDALYSVQTRENRLFDYDGMVLAINDAQLATHLSYISDCPEWARALKPKPTAKLVTITGIGAQVSRLGTVTPVLEFDTVEIDGVQVSSINGDNYPLLKTRGIGIGARVTVGRNGDVIPRIQDVLESADINTPTRCPYCEGALVTMGAKLQCVNLRCGGRNSSHFEYVGSRAVWHIDGMSLLMGQAYWLAVMSNQMGLFTVPIKEVQDAYYLVHQRRADKDIYDVFTAIREREHDLDRVWLALNIPLLGRRVSRLLALKLTWEQVCNMTNDEILDAITQLKLGVTTTVRIRMALLEYGFALLRDWQPHIRVRDLPRPEGSHVGKIVCLSGSMSPYNKGKLQAALEAIGITVSSSVTQHTTLLVAGSGSGAKSERARELDIPIMSAADVVELYQLQVS